MRKISGFWQGANVAGCDKCHAGKLDLRTFGKGHLNNR